MATKVNTKFVAILAVALLGVCGGAAVLYYSFGPKSAAESIAKGEAAAAQGDWEKAMLFYGNAVNKEKTNTVYLEKWIDAMSHTIPKSQQQYVDRFQTEYFAALQQLATVRRVDAAAHARVLGVILDELPRIARESQQWNAYITRVEQAMRLFPETDPNKDRLRRFRGMARVLMMSRGFEIRPTDLKEAIADLETSIKLDPKDEECVTALASIYTRQQAIDFSKGNNVAAEEAAGKARKLLEDFVAAHPPAPEAQSSLSLLNMQLAVRNDAGRTPPQQFALTQQPEAKKALDALLASDLKKVATRVAKQCIQVYLATTRAEGYDAVMAAYAKVLEAKPDNPELLLERAATAQSLGKFEDADKFFAQIAALPDRPLSTEGLMLFGVRPQAVALQADVVLSQWELEKDPANKAKFLEKAKSLRDDFAKRVTGAEPRLVLLDAKIAGAQGDLVKTRQLLSDYNERTDRQDPQALLMLAQVLMQQGNDGGAKQQLQRLNEIKKASPQSMMLQYQVELRQNNLVGAEAMLEQLMVFDPQNKQLQEQLIRIRNAGRGKLSTDPWERDNAKLEELSLQLAPDIAAMKDLAKKLANETEDPARLLKMAARLETLGEKADALATIDRYLAIRPDDANVKRAREALVSTDPIKAMLDEIDKKEMPPVNKALQKAVLLEQAGQRERANEFFKEARTLEPENPLVLAVLFENAVAVGDLTLAKEIADKAEKTNLDKMGGTSFRIRVLLMERDTAKATRMATELTEKDKLNPTAWKLLGECQLAAGNAAPAKNALVRSLQIRNNDPRTAVLLLRSMLALNQGLDALREARERNRFVGGDQEYANLLLDLEFDFGDRDAALTRRQRNFEADAGNLLNTAKLAEWLVRQRKTAEAEKPLAKLREIKAPSIEILEGARELALKNEAGMFAKLDAFVEANKERAKDAGAYLVFARGVGGYGYPEMMIPILEKGRAVQNPENMEIDREIGDIYFNSSQFDKAIVSYKNVLASIKSDADDLVAKRIVECHLRLKQWREALTAAEPIKPAGDTGFQVLLLRADAYAGQNEAAKARIELDAAVKAAPKNPLPLFKRALFNINDDKLQRDAEQDLLACLQLDPRFFGARRQLANAYARQGNTDKMLTLMREGIKIDTSNDEARVLLIRAMQKLGRNDEANALAKDAVEETKGDARWLSVQAELFRQQKDVDREVETVAKIWEQQKNPATAVQYAGALLRKTKPDLIKAREVLSAEEARTEEVGPALLLRAKLARLDGRVPDAEKDAKLGLSKLNTKAVMDTGRYTDDLIQALTAESALAFLKANAKGEADTEAIRFQIARLAASVPAQSDAGKAQLQEIASNTAGDPAIRVAASTMLGELNYAKKEYAEAAKFFQQTLELKPDDANMLNNIAFILSKHLDRSSEALPLAEKAFNLNKEAANFADTLGVVYLKLKQYDKAEQALQRARGLADDALERTPPTIHLADLRLARNDRTGAEQFLRDIQRWLREDSRIEPAHGSDIKDLEKRIKAS